jgi:hypothetical protein
MSQSYYIVAIAAANKNEEGNNKVTLTVFEATLKARMMI